MTLKPYWPLILTVQAALVLLVGFAGGAWIAVVAVVVISAVCVVAGLILGMEAGQSRSASDLTRAHRELATARAELDAQQATNADLWAARDRALRQSEMSAELAESHLVRARRAEAMLPEVAP
ncbi:hypothetical protein OG884_06115 [Streptosporangium sp. NBC_01755]|uniref:hypothetical protein n=1 Tax=Streptosporangium sp. NBC_01755 TaxID=2975949 RepID=UPI002DDC74BF|nr:hypothetical protein [Streptosporangium sp. NBC_01755]WSD01502.1 hypothetical protein OG884_06115 [Streptosporangium sp. NBC_01755]